MEYISRQGTFTYVDPETKEVWEEIEFDSMPHMVSKIDSTHFKMAPKKAVTNRGQFGRPATYHVSEFNHDPEFYEELRKWLKGREMIGGKSFMESSEKENIIEISEPVKIEQENEIIILEKGDRIKILESRGASFYASPSPGHGRFVVTLYESHLMSDETELTYYGSFDNIEDAIKRAEEILPYIEYDWKPPYGPTVDFYIMDKRDRKNTVYYIKSNERVK